MSSLVPYDYDSEEDDDTPTLNMSGKITDVEAAPDVDESQVVQFKLKTQFDAATYVAKSKELTFNPKFQDLYAPEYGPQDPDRAQAGLKKNFLTGHVEPANINEVVFEEERRTKYIMESKERHGTGFFPLATPVTTTEGDDNTDKEINDDQVKKLEETTSVIAAKNNKKRKKVKNMDASDIDGYTGPWAPFEDEVRVSAPSAEDQAEIEVYNSKKKKYTMKADGSQEANDEKSNLHIKDPYDYQGRSFLHAPHDVSFKPDHVPDRCFIPKKLIHTFTGHTKAVTKIRFLPRSGHIFLSSSMDGKVKLWEVYNQRRCIMTYLGHKNAVRDVAFDRFGEKFVSAGYDRALKLWDTETGQCVKRFTARAVPYCVQFNTDDERSNLFLSGMANKKILCWDARTGSICQEYDRHLGAVNTVTFVDHNRRFVSTSDDKSIRVWEWDIPVDIKYIADPTLHSVPAVTLSPNGKWIACQMMDNKIQALACCNRFKLSSKKTFSGHMVAGYSCTPDFSPDMSFLTSGDADGKVFIWDWKTCKLLQTFQAHENVCINTLWHPHETSKLLTAGWDGHIKLWD